jgi:DNA-binding CsgD family transcriptional regulator
MMRHVRRAPPTTSVYPGRVVWALLHTIEDADHGAAARAAYHEGTSPTSLAMFERMGQVIDAVALGRSGDTEGANALVWPAYEATIATPVGLGMVRTTSLLVARAAIRDGWGEPVRWLRECEAWFGEHGFDRLARRARILLGEAGAPVPRRGRGESEVPGSLRALGVTSREMDVLRLVMDGRSTKEIAAQLHLSPKTVERHLTSLFDRTGVRNRQALAEVGVAHIS